MPRLAFCFLFLALSAFANESSLLPCKELTERWNTKLRVDIHDHTDLDPECKEKPAILARALDMLEKKTPHLYRWVIGQIGGVRYESVDNGYTMQIEFRAHLPSAGTLILPEHLKEFWKQALGFSESTSPIQVACMIVHEAGHAQESSTHVPCRHPTRYKRIECDEVFEEGYRGGANNYEVACLKEFYALSAGDSPLHGSAIAASIYWLTSQVFNRIDTQEIKKWKKLAAPVILKDIDLTVHVPEDARLSINGRLRPEKGTERWFYLPVGAHDWNTPFTFHLEAEVERAGKKQKQIHDLTLRPSAIESVRFDFEDGSDQSAN